MFAASAAAGDGSNVVGAVYTISNTASGNALVVYDRSADGSLTLQAASPRAASAPEAASPSIGRWAVLGSNQ